MKSSTFVYCILSALVAPFLMFSCGDSGGADPAPAPTLECSTASLNVGSGIASQKITVTSNTKWSIKSDQIWCALSSTDGNGKADITVTISSTNETVFSQRTATITITTTSGTPQQTKTISVTQDPPGGLADRITVEGSGANARLVITRNPTDAGLFFKFGSVVGIYSGHHANAMLPAGANSDTFDSGDVAFNPTATAAFSTWKAIPYTSGGYIDHTQFKTGKGDPCRLVGYTAQQIKDAIYILDNKTWRLPTNVENIMFTGEIPYETTVHWWDRVGGPNPSPFSGVAGGEFSSRDNGGADKFLPATGLRDPYDGTVHNQGSSGCYWSGLPYSSSMGYHLLILDDIVHPYNPSDVPYGFSVRCVRQ